MLLLHWILTIESLVKFNAGYLPVPGNLPSMCMYVCVQRQPLFLRAEFNLFSTQKQVFPPYLFGRFDDCRLSRIFKHERPEKIPSPIRRNFRASLRVFFYHYKCLTNVSHI
jgi:hypothetical protein